MVAPYDIKVLKYLRKHSDGRFTTPCQETPVTFKEPLEARPSTPQWSAEGQDNYGRAIYSVGAGLVHAKLSPGNDYGNYCVEAVIPKGTKFWIDPFGNDIGAERLIVTENKVSTDRPFIEPGPASIILNLLLKAMVFKSMVNPPTQHKR